MRLETFLIPVLRAVTARPWATKLLFSRDPWGNPFSDEAAADPYPMLSAMWRDGPVSYRRSYQRWFVCGYEECQLLANHPAASAGKQLADTFDDVRPYSQLAPQTRAFFENWMLLRDGTEHGRLRRLVARTFTPRRIAEFEPQVERATAELLDAVKDTSRVEIVAALNRPLPVTVISQLMGFPSERTEWLGEMVAKMSTFLDPMNSFDVDTIDQTQIEFRSYVIELAAERRGNPQSDLISAMAEIGDDGDRLTDDELVANIGLLVFAGHDTTTHMLGNAMVALARHPEQRELVRSRPELWPNAIEELLRFDTTAGSISRQLGEAIEVGDITIPAGANVSLQLNAANRDHRRWDNPDELQVDRDDPRPLSFGHGLHHCVGHALARMELRVALRMFVEQFGDYTIDAETLEWRRSVVLRGPTTLHVTRG